MREFNYAKIDSDGYVIGWFPKTIDYPNIIFDSQEFVEVEDEVWDVRLTSDWKFEGGELVEAIKPIPVEVLIEDANQIRSNILSSSDWIVIKHQELGTPIPQEWLDYRQALRDITEQADYPQTIIWPEEPTGV